MGNDGPRQSQLSIDIVPFKRIGHDPEYPQLQVYSHDQGLWIDNNPPLFTCRFKELGAKFPKLVQVTRLLKYWNHIQTVDEAGKSPCKGMHLESLMLNFPWRERGPEIDSSLFPLSSATCAAFRYCAEHILDDHVGPPGGSAHMGPSYMDIDRREYIRQLIDLAARTAEAAME